MESGAAESAAKRAAMIERIERAKFSTIRLGQGWDEEEVDKFLDRIVKDLREELPVDVAGLRTASFSYTRFRPGYVIADVQTLLNEIVRYADGLPRSGRE
jgi:DivIVA domain-containing protein